METPPWSPGRMLETSSAFWKSCTLHAGVKLNLFTLLGKERLSAEAIAERAGTPPRGIAMLLNALAAMKLIEKKGDTYANTRESEQFLSELSPDYIGHIILHHQHLTQSWSRLDEAVTTGSPTRQKVSFSNEEVRKSFLMGMFNIAMATAPLIVPAIDLTGRKHLIDMGGGPGTFAIHFCKANPDLRATVFDLPTTRPYAEQTIETFAMSDRIDFMGGNYIEEEIKGTYDTAWLSHILHGEGPDQCRNIIRKTVAALEPGGLILIHEFILDNTMDSPEFPALFSLNMLLGTEAGQSYSEEQLAEMLKEAGVTGIRRIPINTPNDSGIIAGTTEK